MLERFLGADVASDSFKPEDWISSFVEAKNKNYVEGEGLSRLADSDSFLIDVVPSDAFGDGRTDSGVLIKLLDSAERLGIQVHPTKEYARRIFNSAYGKTECW